jgi:hypothetical protein
MKKKKIGYFISAFLITLIISGGIYYYSVYNSVKTITIHGNYIKDNTEEELNERADIILYGSPVDKFEEREHVNIKNEYGVIADYYTLTNFKVKKVLKNITSLQINKKDLFSVIEPIGFIQEFDGKKIISMDSYEAMVENTNYIIYLKSNNRGGYSIINFSNGKFNMDVDINTDNSQLNKLKSTNSLDIIEFKTHLDMKKDIVSKYSKTIAE